MIEIDSSKIPIPKWKWQNVLLSLLVAGFSICLILIWSQTLPPKDFPVGVNVSIPRGLSASMIANRLAEQRVVKSGGLLYLILIWQYDPASVQAGSYYFDKPLSISDVAKRITSNSAFDSLMMLTLPEGYTVKEFAQFADEVLVDFDKELFYELTKEKEGFLFPDTYYVPYDFTATEVVNLLVDTYHEKTKELFENNQSGLTEYEVITLASLLEREGNTEESMRIIAGILLSRLEIPMRLQVDASIEYVVGHKMNGTRADDLKIDSPYNTYLYDGLPPTPIANPGLTAIKAVLDPIKTDYLYYITGNDGEFYYASSFEDHKKNIEKYLQ